jgi:hypothetical protein
VVYPSQWKRIEEEYEEPMDVLLPRLLTKYGQRETAAKLDVRPETIWKWQKQLNIERICRYGPSGQVKAG